MSFGFVRLGLATVMMAGWLSLPVSECHGSWVVNVGDQIKLYDGPGNVNAGEFIVKDSGDNYATEKFRTFCVQTDEFLRLGEVLTVIGINDYSVSPANYLRAKTSALYREFVRGAGTFFDNSAATYHFDGGINDQTRITDGGLLQKAIWFYQEQDSGYASLDAALSNKFVSAVEDFWTSKDWADGLLAKDFDDDRYNGVQILNLTRVVGNNSSFPAQDQLYYNPPAASGSGLTTVTPVPEPTTVVLFAIGSVSVGLIRRRTAVVAR